MKNYSINQCYLYKCHSKKKLSNALNVDIKELKSIANNPKYHSFVKEKNGKKRELFDPDIKLKKIQKTINKYLQPVYRPYYLNGGEKSKSIVTNGNVHKNNDYIFKADIFNFYPNCKRDYVYNFYKNNLECSSDVAKILTDLTTYKGQLIQGAPTSTLLSYFAYSSMFKEIYNLAKFNKLDFSTYADDLTFSSNVNFKASFIQFKLGKILNAYGHKLKTKKCRFIPKNKVKKLPGLIIKDGSLRVLNVQRKNIIDLYNDINKYDKNQNELIKIKLRSSIYAARQIEPKIFSKILSHL